jgi:acyl-CoA reductase-like NAD-dependent aldehyde dehydrogenase/nicotinamidase-related amidase
MNPVLLLLDLQADFLGSAGLQPAREQLVRAAAAALQDARQKKFPVVHVWTSLARDDRRRLPHWKKSPRQLCVVGTAGHETPAPLRPQAGEPVIPKTGFNGFAGGALDAALKPFQCDTVVIAGVHLHTCVRTLAAESLERGLRVFVIADAVGSHDPVLAAATRRWLAERCVEFLPAPEIWSRIAGRKPSRLVHRSPRDTRKILFAVRRAGAEEIAAATRAASRAGKSWQESTLARRLKIFEKVAARLEQAAPEFAWQMAREIGKPMAHGHEEMRRAAANVRDVIRRAAVFELEPAAAGDRVRHAPRGVVALISPWNNPVAIPIGKIAPALIYGNTVVWKPAPAATRISKAILKLLHDCALPRRLVQLMTGDAATAQTIAADERINAVTLTGSAAAGFAIQEICARRFTPLQAELSGNNAAIVWDDADLSAAARQIAWGAFGFAGQRCTANRRVIVPKKLAATFVRELRRAAEKMSWGDPLKMNTDIGPVIHAGTRDELAAQIADAKKSGAAWRVEPLFGAHAKQPWVRAGAYARPVIVGCDVPGHPLVQEETMSPLLVVQRAQNFQHALELCNGVRHGLAAALFTASGARQKKFLATAQAGILKINAATAGADVSLPFGGWKMSGVGPPEHGVGDAQFYTQMQAVYAAAD